MSSWMKTAFPRARTVPSGRLNLGLMEELASIAVRVAADEYERLEERDRAQVIDFHMTGDGEDVERPVELAHRLIEQRCHDTAVNVARRAFMEAVELKVRGGGGMFRDRCVGREDKMETLRIGRTATEAVAGPFIDGGVAIHGERGVADCVLGRHGLW